MAKYKLGEDAMVGDVIQRTTEVIANLGGMRVGGIYTVRELDRESFVSVHEVNWYVFVAENFTLIRRAPSPKPEQPSVTHEQSPPLVVWPEETPTIYKDLNPGERFVFASSPQVVRMIIDGGNYVITDKSNDPYYNQIGYVSFAEADYPVRRVKYVTAPQFTVI